MRRTILYIRLPFFLVNVMRKKFQKRYDTSNYVLRLQNRARLRAVGYTVADAFEMVFILFAHCSYLCSNSTTIFPLFYFYFFCTFKKKISE